MVCPARGRYLEKNCPWKPNGTRCGARARASSERSAAHAVHHHRHQHAVVLILAAGSRDEYRFAGPLVRLTPGVVPARLDVELDDVLQERGLAL